MNHLTHFFLFMTSATFHGNGGKLTYSCYGSPIQELWRLSPTDSAELQGAFFAPIVTSRNGCGLNALLSPLARHSHSWQHHSAPIQQRSLLVNAAGYILSCFNLEPQLQLLQGRIQSSSTFVFFCYEGSCLTAISINKVYCHWTWWASGRRHIIKPAVTIFERP